LMTTGVDAKMCELIVLENNINSMTEFKQIIGRGTRLLEEYGKTYFTIMDFRNVSRLFADPEFDGTPEVVMDIEDDKPVFDPEPEDSRDDEGSREEWGEIIIDPPVDFTTTGEEDDEDPRKYSVGDVPVKVSAERVQYIDKAGKLIIERLIDYTKKNIIDRYTKLDDFLESRTQAERKNAILDELEDNGVFLEAVREEAGRDDLDDFDLICHLAYDKPPLTKKEREIGRAHV